MEKLTAEKCRELIWTGRYARKMGVLSCIGELKLEALQIALPILEKQESDMKTELKPHAILLPGGALAAIVLTKQMAEDYALNFYRPGSYSIVVVEEHHYKELKGE